MLQVNFHPFPEISTERLLLRRIKNQDAAQLLKLRSDKNVMKYIGRKPMVTLKDATDFVTLMNHSVDSNAGIDWAMSLKENSEELIGTIGLWRIIKENFRAEIGYMLLPQYWRKGLTKEAILKVIDFGFNELNLHSIEGRINPQNIASGKILESAGFAKEAHFKEDYFFEGKFKDTVIYSLISPNPFLQIL